jgi:hypothetical protein
MCGKTLAFVHLDDKRGYWKLTHHPVPAAFCFPAGRVSIVRTPRAVLIAAAKRPTTRWIFRLTTTKN